MFLGSGIPRCNAFLLPRLRSEGCHKMYPSRFRCNSVRCDRDTHREIPSRHEDVVSAFLRPLRAARKLPREKTVSGRETPPRAIELACRRQRRKILTQEYR